MAKIRQKYWQYLISDEGVPVSNTKVKIFNSAAVVGVVTLGSLTTTIPIYDSINNTSKVPNSEVTTDVNGYFEFWVQSDTDSPSGIVDSNLDVSFVQKVRFEWSQGGVTQGSIDDIFVGTYSTGPSGTTPSFSVTGNVYISSTTPASVRNVGSSSNIKFEFSLPQGPVGLIGNTGATGATGTTGADGPQGVAASSVGLSLVNPILRHSITGPFTPLSQTSSQSGTFNYTGPTITAIVAITSGGGGGHNNGGGGAGGGTLIVNMTLVNGQPYSYILGKGGTGGVGGNGGTTTFNGTMSDLAGQGGSGGNGGSNWYKDAVYSGTGGTAGMGSNYGGSVVYNEGILPYMWQSGGAYYIGPPANASASGGGASLFGAGGAAYVEGKFGSGGGCAANGGRGCVNIFY